MKSTDGRDERARTPAGRNHRAHRWVMILCCMPMLLVALVLVATDTVEAGTLLVVIGCSLMMVLMMGGMGHDDRRR